MDARTSRSMPASDLVLAAVALVVITALVFLGPHSLLNMADRAAYAVCHRLPDHSFTIAGRQLPLCARCSGTYLGALTALTVLWARGRGRAGRFPARPFLLVLGLFMLAWAVDGLNSFLALLDLPHLYTPSNELRLITGALEGVVVAAVLLPALNMALWRAPDDVRTMGNVRDLLWLLVGAAVAVAAVGSEWSPLLYPIALFSGATIAALLGALNAMFYLAARRRDGTARRWQEVVSPLLVGLALALSEIALIGLARDALSARLGLPF